MATSTRRGSAGALTSISQARKAARDSAAAVAVPPSAPPPQADAKPATDVVAGAMARAASQGTIHPLDTMKVRMQAGRGSGRSCSTGRSLQPGSSGGAATMTQPQTHALSLQRRLHELKGLYKGVGGAAAGAGIIIGTYFAFYSTTKRFLKNRTQMKEGSVAFVSGATAAVGSGVVKVPLAVCIRSVQAGIYKNVIHASQSIVDAAGWRGLFTGFLPTLLEDVPDMAVKFAVYETVRPLLRRLRGDAPACMAEDLLIGGFAGAAAAASTTPLDVIKTHMMCSAASRPTFRSATRAILAEGRGVAPFFRGLAPRTLSNAINSAIFFCFFEAIRQVLIKREAAALAAAPTAVVQPSRAIASAKSSALLNVSRRTAAHSPSKPASDCLACLQFALPLQEGDVYT